MKKTRILLILSLLLTFGCIATTVCAAVLSPALEVLTAEATVVKTAAPGETVTFSDADFRQALGVTTYPDITILSLPDPTEGILKLGGLRVSVGETVHRAEVSRLSFTPATQFVARASFTFRAGNLSGGAALSCSLLFEEGENHAPNVEGADTSVFWHTRRNVSVFGTLAGYDPDGDALEYLIVTYPAHGTLCVTGKSTGDFRYTPLSGYTGADSFTYVVRDARGYYSAPATVKIQVDKKTMDLDFDDLEDTGSSFAASLVAAGVMGAEEEEGKLYFHPEESMSRAAFVVAAMKATGHAPAHAGSETCFDDNRDIPAPLRPYLSAAADAGYLIGELSGGKLLCRPNDPITESEAYRILSRMTGSPVNVTTEEAVQVLAGLGCSTESTAGASALTRLRAAEILYRAAQA